MRSAGKIQISKDARGETFLEAVVSGIFFPEGDKWIAYCQMLDLSSCGNTVNEALENVKEAIQLFFDSCIKRNTLHKALAELGWVCQAPDGSFKELTKGCLPDRIPPAFVIEQLKKKGETWSGKVTLKDV